MADSNSVVYYELLCIMKSKKFCTFFFSFIRYLENDKTSWVYCITLMIIPNPILCMEILCKNCIYIYIFNKKNYTCKFTRGGNVSEGETEIP